MKKLTLFFSFIFLLLSTQAGAVTHLKMSVTVNLEKARLEVSGTASKPVALPNNMHKVSEFAYNWPLPSKQTERNWKGGAFVSDTDLYLPSGWFPQSDDFITFDIQLSAPLVTVLPGKITNEVNSGSSYSARFTMTKPTEGIPLFAGPYRIDERQTDAIRLRTYFYDDMQPLSEGYLQRTSQYIQRFNQQIGPYPFEEFHIIAAPIPAGFGFAGATYIGAHVLQLPFIKETSLGHEILHNYWGNGVFPDYDSGNWAEGLTTYMADYMTAEAASEEKAKDMRLAWLRDYAALPPEQDKPVSRFVSKHTSASQVIGYHKVAFIFHMLRQQLGDKTFFAGLRHFWKNHAFRTANWKDLETSFTSTSGKDLSAFFKQWVERTGAPSFKNISARAINQDRGDWQINVRVTQDQPTFKTAVPISVGTRTNMLRQQFFISGVIGAGKFHTKDQPTGLSLDPDFDIFRKLGPNEAPPIIRDVTLASKVDVVIAANDPEFRKSAQTLVARMIEGKSLSNDGQLPKNPFLIIAQMSLIDNLLKKWSLRPSGMKRVENATATVWADKIFGNIPYVVVSVKDTESLNALLRPLPHYGKRSTLVFEGQRAVHKSTYPPRPISVPIH